MFWVRRKSWIFLLTPVKGVMALEALDVLTALERLTALDGLVWVIQDMHPIRSKTSWKLTLVTPNHFFSLRLATL